MSEFDEFRDMQPGRNIEVLLKVMERLRHKENGCPWDIKQTFSSIAPYTIEEAYEVKDAIERNDMPDLCEELGDLLLQVVYHARIAQEQGYFHFEDVVEAVTRKMIRRHPHVFGSESQKQEGMKTGTWEKIKEQEKEERALRQRKNSFQPTNLDEGLLADIPVALPSLRRAIKLQKRAATVGFDWHDVNFVFEKLTEETEELKAEIVDGNPTIHAEEELGDLLFVMVNIARHLKIDPEKALDRANRKFIDRFRHMEKNAEKQERQLNHLTLDELETLWVAAKIKTRKSS